MPELTIGRKNISRSLVSRFYDKFGGISDYYCIYNIPLKHLHKFDLSGYADIYSPGAFDGLESIFDFLVNQNISHQVFSWRTPSSEAFKALVDDIRNNARSFYFLYSAELDSLLHKYGNNNTEAIRPFLKELEERVSEVYDAAQAVCSNVRIHLFSDHGMCNVRHTADLRGAIHKLPVIEFKDYVPFYDSTMARFYTSSERVRDIIRTELAALSFGGILSAAELKDLGVNFPDNKFGDIIYLMSPGELINPSFVGKKAPAGMHGYHPDHEDSYAAFLSNYAQQDPINTICDFCGIMKREAQSSPT